MIEILVSLTIFSLVATASVGAVLAVLSANAKSQSMKAVMDNLSVAIEDMSRSIRIGTNYHCLSAARTADSPEQATIDDTSCTTGAIGISFDPQDKDQTDANDHMEYYFNAANGALYRYRPNLDTNPIGTVLTAPEVHITSVNFYVYGQSTDYDQPRVYMVVSGTAGQTNKQQSQFSIETTVSERTIASTGGTESGGGGSGGGSSETCPTGTFPQTVGIAAQNFSPFYTAKFGFDSGEVFTSEEVMQSTGACSWSVAFTPSSYRFTSDPTSINMTYNLGWNPNYVQGNGVQTGAWEFTYTMSGVESGRSVDMEAVYDNVSSISGPYNNSSVTDGYATPQQFNVGE